MMSIFEQVHREYACDHVGSTHLTFFIGHGESTHYRSQCLDCGAFVAAVKKDSLTPAQMKDAIPWNESLKDARADRLAVIVDRRKEEERQQSRQDFQERHRKATSGERWQMLRRKVIARCGGICEGCGEGRVQDVHHRHYKRLGGEFLFDLVGLCRDCHERMHQRGNHAVAADPGEDDADYDF